MSVAASEGCTIVAAAVWPATVSQLLEVRLVNLHQRHVVY